MKLLLPGFWHVFRALWRVRVAWFWPIWMAMTCAAAAITVWIVRSGAPSFAQQPKHIPVLQPRRDSKPYVLIVATMLLALLLAGYMIETLKGEVFANYDDSYFTLFALRGQDSGPPVWISNGRFFPAAHQEFNFIRHFTGSVAGYHLLPLVQLSIFSCALLVLDDELSVIVRIAFAALVLLLPSIVIIFTGLIFPERNVVFWLVLLVLSVSRFDQTEAAPFAVAAVISAQFMLYYKETAFLLLWGLAAGRLLLRCKRTDAPGWNLDRLHTKESRLDMSLIFLGAIFLLYYAAAMFPHPNMHYAEEQRVPIAQIFAYYEKTDLLAWALVVIVLRRAYLIVRWQVPPSPTWDGLAIGGVAYFAAYLYLRLSTPYYLAPVDVIAVLVVGHLTIISWEKMNLWMKAIALAFALAVLVQGIALSAFREFERKNTIRAKAEIGDLIESCYRDSSGQVQRLFFPFADVYPITEFAAYLTYRGVPVQEGSAKELRSNSVVLIAKTLAKDGPCVDYRAFACLARSSPEPGDLVIELPDDGDSLAEIARYRDGGVTLLSYDPSPMLPKWFRPILNELRTASVRFQYKDLPDRWLHASVIRWK